MKNKKTFIITAIGKSKRHTLQFTSFITHSSPYSLIALSPQRAAFTIAEILISLTIIGIIAAITLPSLRANINETTWNTQRKALYSRLSQAIAMMPSLNGYGIGSTDAETNEKAALAFVTDGLSKVLQINNICDSTNIKKCGISNKIKTMAGNNINFPKNLTELNPMFTSTYASSYTNPQSNIDTNVAAFETKNGENIAVFYNPYCLHDNGETSKNYTQPKMCANFIYDLNGRKGPNKVGKDVGFITALYPTDSEVVAPMPLNKELRTNNQADASTSCRNYDENSRLPNRIELSAMFYNKDLIDLVEFNHWSASIYDTDNGWVLSVRTGIFYVKDRKDSNAVRCIKR